MDLAPVLLDHLQRDEQQPVILLRFWALAAMQRVFHGQLGQVEDLLHHQDLGGLRVLQGYPGKKVGITQGVRQGRDIDVGQALAVLVGGALDDHGAGGVVESQQVLL